MRPVIVEVALHPTLRDAIAGVADAARAHVERELVAAIGGWGLPFRPDVRFDTLPGDRLAQPVRLTVDGRVCLVPPGVAAEALAYAGDSPNVPSPQRGSIDGLDWPSVDGVAPEVLGEALGLVVRAAVSARPEVLVPLDDPLAELLRLGMSAAGEDLDVLRAQLRVAPGPVLDRLAAPTIDLLIEPTYLRDLLAAEAGGELFSFLRDGLFVELGVNFPPMRIQLDPALRTRGFAFRVNATRTTPQIGLALDTILVNDTAERLKLMDITATVSTNPATGHPGAVTTDGHKNMLEAAGLTTWTSFGYYILALAAALRRQMAWLITPARVRAMLDELGRASPAVAANLPDRMVAEVLAPLFRELLADELSLRNLRQIVQVVRRHGVAPETSGGLDLASLVRSEMADYIGYKIGRGTGTVVVYILDPELERGLVERPTVDADLAEEICTAYRNEIDHLPPTAQVPAVLTAQRVRGALRRVLRAEYPYVKVLSYTDLPAGINIQPVARISSR